MDNFNLRKYLAEGKLLNEVELTDDLVQRVAQAVADEFTAEDRELDLKYIITPNSVESDSTRGLGGFDLDVEAGPNTPGDDWKDSRGFGIANYLGDYAGGSFMIRPEGKGYLVTNAALMNAKVAYITPEGEIEIISAEDSKADLGMTDDVETDYMERRREMSDYMDEAYTPGLGWTKDFSYDSMFAVALKLHVDSPMGLLKKVSSDLEDVNYHRENSYLTDAIDAIEAGDRAEAKIAINRFRKEIKKNINENTIKEQKESKIQTKMKKSELKEMIKTALLNEYSDDYTNEQEEVDVEDNEKVDVDIEKDVEIDDEEKSVDIDVKASMPGESQDVEAVQGLLMKAQEEATKLGDEKLTDQIGNTITYFTRAHVATVSEETDYDNTDAVSGDINITTDNPAADAELGLALNEEVNRFKKLAGIIK